MSSFCFSHPSILINKGACFSLLNIQIKVNINGLFNTNLASLIVHSFLLQASFVMLRNFFTASLLSEKKIQN